MRRKNLPSWMLPAFAVCLSFGAAMLVVALFTGQWVTKWNSYDSYTLQALSWLNGHLELVDGEEYPWLELAIYQGKYYVSFPPFPSYVLLPFAAVMGQDTPDGWIALFFAMLSCIYATRLYIEVTGGSRHLILLVLFLLLGNGYLYLTVNGWVWFIAQNMCFSLSMMALYAAWKGKGGLSFTLWACAVGCRPMTAIYFPLLAWLAVRHWKETVPGITLPRLIARKWYWAIGPLLLAASYMTLNYLRFGNVLEFGHNYLPEFTRTATGQFNISYLLRNLQAYLTLPEWVDDSSGVSFNGLDGMAFYLFNPLLALLIPVWIFAGIRGRRNAVWYFLPLLLIVHVLIICLHKTLGGVQFGNRYLVDLLPWAFLGLLLWKPKDERFSWIVTPLAVFGIAINLVGTIFSYSNLL